MPKRRNQPSRPARKASRRDGNSQSSTPLSAVQKQLLAPGGAELQREASQLQSTTKRLEKTAAQLHRTIDTAHARAEEAHQTLRGKPASAPKKHTLFPIVGIGASAG